MNDSVAKCTHHPIYYTYCCNLLQQGCRGCSQSGLPSHPRTPKNGHKEIETHSSMIKGVSLISPKNSIGLSS